MDGGSARRQRNLRSPVSGIAAARVSTGRTPDRHMSNAPSAAPRYDRALAHLAAAVSIISTAGSSPALTTQQRVDELRTAMDQVSAAFKAITRRWCRSCVKVVMLAEMPDGRTAETPEPCVATLCRNTDYDGQDPLHIVRENTAFQLLLRDHELECFFGNDLLTLARKGAYTNTTDHWEKRYRAAIVWPIRSPVSPLPTPHDLIGYLCVDARRAGVFHIPWDCFLGTILCHALSPVISRILDDTFEEPE